MNTEFTFTPRLTFLSDRDRDRTHQAVLRILAETGAQVMHPEARRLLAGAGCRVEPGLPIRLPADLVMWAIDRAPASIPVYDRQARQVMDVGGRRSYFGTGSDLMFACDPGPPLRRACVLEDVRRAAVVADALPNIDFIMSFAHPSDYPAERAFLKGFEAMVENSLKPVVCTAHGREDLSRMWQIGCLLRGGEAALREKPYIIHYSEPISPLKFPVESLDKLLFCAEKGLPVVYSPAPIAGSTAPMTIAGHVAQGLAESLCGLVVHQLKAEGAPFLLGMGPAVLDMRTSQCSYNAPEYLMGHQAAIEMSLYYDLPNWGYGGTTDSQTPDEQAVFEAGLEVFMAILAGSNLNHDVGYMDFGRTGSLELIVILDEIIDQARRVQRGIPVTEDTLAVDVLREVGSSGHFLLHPHTLRHLRATQWRPSLISRWGYEKWQSAGATTLRRRAAGRLQEILNAHRPPPLPPELGRAVRRVVDGYLPERKRPPAPSGTD
jgi:trimethylamine--corrinoid protein Co-methyltransferase